MAKGKKPTGRKPAAVKAAGKPRPRKRPIKAAAVKPGPGHNNPPKEEVLHAPRPFMTSWATDTTSQIARYTAQRQRTRIARTGIGTVTTGTPHAQAHDPTYLHQVMLRSIAALEKTIRKLPTPHDEEVEEVKRELAKLKALPPVPTSAANRRGASTSQVKKVWRAGLVVSGNTGRFCSGESSSEGTMGELRSSTDSYRTGYR